MSALNSGAESPVDAAAASRRYSDAANTIRLEGKRAGGNVEATAWKYADDLDNLGFSLQPRAGELSVVKPTPNDMGHHAHDLLDACRE